MKCIWLFIVLLSISGCAAGLQEAGIDLSSPDRGSFKVVEPKMEVSGMANYTFNGRKGKVSWFSCSAPKKGDVVVLINPDFSEFNSQVCRGAVAQAFLSKNVSVFALNRPGYGKSTPKERDFSGAITSAAIDATVAQGIKSISWFKKPDGVWATGSAVIAAGLLSKRTKDINWLILGNGIYDMEEFYAKSGDSRYKKLIDDARGDNDPSAFAEERSLAWDTSGLAKKIALYHGKGNIVIDPSQSESMRDTLAAEEYQVSLEIIEKLTHDISPAQHRIILEAILGRWEKSD